MRPRTAQARSTLESRARSLVPRLAAAGVAVTLLALALLAVTRESLVASFVALFALLLAAAFLAPTFTVAACALAARALGPLTGSIGRMAARAIVRNLSRNAVATWLLSEETRERWPVGEWIPYREMYENFRTWGESGYAHGELNEKNFQIRIQEMCADGWLEKSRQRPGMGSRIRERLGKNPVVGYTLTDEVRGVS